MGDYVEPEVIDQETLSKVRQLTSNGPGPGWQTRDQDYQEFIKSDEFRKILAMMSLEIHTHRWKAKHGATPTNILRDAVLCMDAGDFVKDFIDEAKREGLTEDGTTLIDET